MPQQQQQFSLDQIFRNTLNDYYQRSAQFVASPCAGGEDCFDDDDALETSIGVTSKKQESFRTAATVDDDDSDLTALTVPLSVILQDQRDDENENEEYPCSDDDEEEEDESQYHCPPILSLTQMEAIREHLPFSLRDRVWERIFSIGIHGDSFSSFLKQCKGYKSTVVVMRTERGQIVGGFASEEWKRNDHQQDYYGSGQSFVFASHPDDGTVVKDGQHLAVYHWTGMNDYCQICDPDKRIFCMGGVGDFGWIVSDGFATGRSGRSGTFGNPPLARPACFGIAELEVYGLSRPMLGMS